MKLAIVRIGIAALLALAIPSAASAGQSATTIAAIARQFDEHPLIMIGELHRSREIHGFLQQMLRDPAFICRADDIVVEFGNARLQTLADAYVSGGDVTDAQLQSVWRETAVPLTWNSPVYRQIYETVRDINRTHLCPRPLRIVLGDQPLDWSKIKTAKDYAQFTDRDGHYAEIVEREVLARHHRALLIAGEFHALKSVPKDVQDGPDSPDAAQIIETRHPGALFSIVTVPSPDVAQAMQLGPPPDFRIVRGSALDQLSFGVLAPGAAATPASLGGQRVWKLVPAKNWPRMGEEVDALLYLGGDHSLYPSPTIYLDPIYQKELRRRAAIIRAYNGQDFLSVIDGLVKAGEAEEAASPASR
jgi:hypothetical protein